MNKRITYFLFPFFGLLISFNSVFSQSDSLFYKAVNAIAAGDASIAIELLESEEKLSFSGFYNLGIAYGKEEKWSKALWAFESALKQHPNHSEAMHNAQFSLQKIDDRATWNHPFSSWHRFILRLPVGMWYALVFSFFLIAGIVVFVMIKNKHSSYKLLLYRIALGGCIALGVIGISIGYGAEQFLSKKHYVMPLKKEIPTFASRDGVALETVLLKGQRYAFLVEHSDWVQVNYTDERPLWVKREDVLSY